MSVSNLIFEHIFTLKSVPSKKNKKKIMEQKNENI